MYVYKHQRVFEIGAKLRRGRCSILNARYCSKIFVLFVRFLHSVSNMLSPTGSQSSLTCGFSHFFSLNLSSRAWPAKFWLGLGVLIQGAQYFVCPPGDSITASTPRGIDSMRVWQVSAVIAFHASRTLSHNSNTPLGASGWVLNKFFR